jgi:hypothetical protein
MSCSRICGDWGWASLRKDDVAIMIATLNAHMPYEKIGFTGSFDYGMREFAIYDNNGYLLQFGTEIA